MARGKIGGSLLSSPLKVNLWRRAEALFEAALDRPKTEQLAFLQRACGNDEELLAAVQALLSQDEAGSPVLDSPLDNPVRNPSARALQSLATDRRVGPYRLVRSLGEGGMSQVFLGQREGDEVEQEVAVKFLPEGLEDARLLRSLRRERQILAGLDHPNIGRFLDSGSTEEGSPYVVLEYVQGMPLTEYCDLVRLGLRQRLQMFRKVCEAVDYAHRQLVVHLDLKPDNILVTDDGEPKLLDFGIAKILDSTRSLMSRDVTRTQDRFLTPAYASPEQIAGRSLSTSSDIYSLGVILYQLLTGLRPGDLEFPPGDSPVLADGNGLVLPSEAVKRAAEATKSAEFRGTTTTHLVKQLVGDLDSVVLRCLQPVPVDRYPSAASIADDLRRHLGGLPVQARPPFWSYRLGKFLRRHAVAAVFATLAAGALGALGVGTALQSRQVALERGVAEQARVEAEEVTRFLTEAFTFVDPFRRPVEEGKAREPATVEDVLRFSAERVRNRFPDQPLVTARLLFTLGEVYSEMGQVQEGMAFHEEALEIRRLESAPPHLEIAKSLNGVSVVLINLGRFSEAEPLIEEALEISQEAGNEGVEQLAASLANSGMSAFLQGQRTAADPLLRESVTLYESLDEPDERTLTAVYESLGQLQRFIGKFEEAESFFSQALEMSTRLYGRENLRTINILAASATVLEDRGDYAAAEPYFREALEGTTRELGPLHENSITALGRFGLFLRNRGDLDGAETSFREALELRRRSPLSLWDAEAALLNNLGLVFLDKGDGPEAEAHFRQALEMIRIAAPEGAARESVFLGNLGLSLLTQKRAAEAEPLVRESVSQVRENLGPRSPPLAFASTTLAATLVALRRYQEALDHSQEALDILLLELPSNHPRVAQAQVAKGAALAGLGRLEEAEPILLEGYSDLQEGNAPARAISAARQHLFELYRSWNKPDLALEFESPDPSAAVSQR